MEVSLDGVPDGEVVVEIFDLIGRQAYHWQGKMGSTLLHTIDLRGAATGYYLVKVSMDSGMVVRPVVYAR